MRGRSTRAEPCSILLTNMSVQSVDPVRELGHSHEHLTKLVLEAGHLLRATPGERKVEGTALRLRTCLGSLRENLLRHFALEEEGLFPFIRASLPGRGEQVDRLALAHDTICGSVVRLAHAADTGQANEDRSALASLYGRFETAYARHSREEADLFAELERALDASQRAQLAELLRGL